MHRHLCVSMPKALIRGARARVCVCVCVCVRGWMGKNNSFEPYRGNKR